MGEWIGCGTCGAQVYTTGTRFPPHKTEDGERCKAQHPALEPTEYATGRDGDPWVYQGGAWEQGKDA